MFSLPLAQTGEFTEPSSHWNLSLAQGDRLQEISCPSVTITVGVKQSLAEQGWQGAQAICCLYCNSLLKKGSVYNLHVWNSYSFKFQIGSAKNTYCGTQLGIHLELKYGSSRISLKILHANYKYMSIFSRTLCLRLQASISITWDSEEFQFCQRNLEMSPYSGLVVGTKWLAPLS